MVEGNLLAKPTHFKRLYKLTVLANREKKHTRIEFGIFSYRATIFC